MNISDNKKAHDLGGQGLIDVNHRGVSTMTSLALSFNDVNFEAITYQNEVWLGSTQIGLALEYANPESAITKLFNRNSDEFTSSMTRLIETKTNGGVQKVRVFSLRGCHLLAMFARTAVAKLFRKWVLDILDKEVQTPNQEQLKIEDKTTKQERVPLKDAVNLLVAKSKFLNYPDAYGLIHQRFNVNSIGEIPYDQIPTAVEYVHHLIGEYVPKLETIEDEDLKSLKLLDAEVSNKISDWLNSLYTEIKRLKGNVPEYPNLNKEDVARAVVTRIVQSQRMLLSVDYSTGKPKIQFLPSESWIISSDNISKIIGSREGPKKELLPDIIEAAVKRLTS